jgi:hypothetical protein
MSDAIELAEWTIAEFEAIDPEVHAEYRVDVGIAVKLARAVLELSIDADWVLVDNVDGSLHHAREPDIAKRVGAWVATWKRRANELYRLEEENLALRTERDTIRAEVERLRGVLLSLCEWDAGYGGYQHNVALARVITEARAALDGGD